MEIPLEAPLASTMIVRQGFLDLGHKIGGYVTGTFCFLKKENSWLIFLNFHFQQFLFGATVETCDIPRDDINGITWEEVENNFSS